MKENATKWKKMKENERKWKKMTENENERKWKKMKENENEGKWKKMRKMKENERKWWKMKTHDHFSNGRCSSLAGRTALLQLFCLTHGIGHNGASLQRGKQFEPDNLPDAADDVWHVALLRENLLTPLPKGTETPQGPCSATAHTQGPATACTQHSNGAQSKETHVSNDKATVPCRMWRWSHRSPRDRKKATWFPEKLHKVADCHTNMRTHTVAKANVSDKNSSHGAKKVASVVLFWPKWLPVKFWGIKPVTGKNYLIRKRALREI